MEGADESTELWRHPTGCVFVYDDDTLFASKFVHLIVEICVGEML